MNNMYTAPNWTEEQKKERQAFRKRANEMMKMWNYIEQYVETFGELPAQKIWKFVDDFVDETYEFYRCEENMNSFTVYYKQTRKNFGTVENTIIINRFLD